MSAAPGTARYGRRTLVVALAFLACFVAYTDRVNISVAAVAMGEQLGWSQTQKGFVLSAFFVGYMAFMLASGWFAARFGGKRVLGLAVVAWSVFTLLTPWAASISLEALIVCRILMGAGEAALLPAAFELFGRWVPVPERTRAMAWMFSGIPLGTLIGLMVTGWIVKHWDWPAAFYFFGPLGLIWAAYWFAQVHDDPAHDPKVSPAERTLLAADVARAPAGAIPWRRLLLRLPVLAMVAAHFATTWSLYVLLSWLPSYFHNVQHLDIAKAGLYSAAPWLAMFAVMNSAAPALDRAIRAGASITRMRKLAQCGGLLGSAAFLLLARGAESPASALAIVCCSTGLLGLAFCGYGPNSLDVAPRYASVLSAFSNTFATIPGIVGVAITGWLIDATGTYSAAFVLTASVSLVCAIVYGALFDARPLFPEHEPAR